MAPETVPNSSGSDGNGAPDNDVIVIEDDSSDEDEEMLLESVSNSSDEDNHKVVIVQMKMKRCQQKVFQVVRKNVNDQFGSKTVQQMKIHHHKVRVNRNEDLKFNFFEKRLQRILKKYIFISYYLL